MTIFRQKLKISFSKTRLNQIIDELRNYNSDLHRLSSQIQRLQSNALQSPVTANSAFLSHLKVTQQASGRLYDILASEWLCDDQVTHTASMDLRVEERCRDSNSQVSFSLGIACWRPTAQQLPFWLSFESASIDQSQIISAVQTSDLEDTLVKKMGAKPKVRFGLSFLKGVSTISKPAGSSRPMQQPPLDLCSMGKLCNYFRQMARPPGDPCLGLLAKANTFKHLVYQVPVTQIPSTQNSHSLSLKDILYSAAMRNKQEDWIAKLKLARLLTLAVLRFYETSWLAKTWSSSDIQFFKKETPVPDDHVLETPYLNACLLDENASGKLLGTSESLATNPGMLTPTSISIKEPTGHPNPRKSLTT